MAFSREWSEPRHGWRRIVRKCPEMAKSVRNCPEMSTACHEMSASGTVARPPCPPDACGAPPASVPPAAIAFPPQMRRNRPGLSLKKPGTARQSIHPLPKPGYHTLPPPRKHLPFRCKSPPPQCNPDRRRVPQTTQAYSEPHPFLPSRQSRHAPVRGWLNSAYRITHVI